jgi:hypothetical protein
MRLYTPKYAIIAKQRNLHKTKTLTHSYSLRQAMSYSKKMVYFASLINRVETSKFNHKDYVSKN